MDFRCAAASLADGEPLAGTAPTDDRWLMVEHDEPWGARALAESRLPDAVREALLDLEGVRVQLIRRHGRSARADGVRVLAATIDPGGEVALGRTVLDDVTGVLDLDLASLAAGHQPLPAHPGPAWLVCANGRRDVCCAEDGRPVAAALAERWPDATWETTHLGGHRFAGTLVAWPAGVCLGRLDAPAALRACAALADGRDVDPAVLRGRPGLDPAAQVALAHVAAQRPDAKPRPVDREDLDAVAGTTSIDVVAGDERWRVVVLREPGARRQSCADPATKPTTAFRVQAGAPA